ncbi:hypothetical protein PG996_003735 [Apiospora saccharicola]|uniref:Uncharacterized protein n=1 Tax=Apiospora saccharicola TaxID=335842 RepID=A0ABR1W240_9PEZI
MLRLPPTTISVTMTEVRNFEHHRRFKRYLARNNSRTRRSPTQYEHDGSVVKESLTATPRTQNLQDTDEPGNTETPKGRTQPDTPKLFSLPPRRPPKFTLVPAKEASTSHEASESSQSTSFYASTLSGDEQGPNSSGTRLPPSFSIGGGTASDELSLPFRTFNQGPSDSSEELARDYHPITLYSRPSPRGARAQTETRNSIPAEHGSDASLDSVAHDAESAEWPITQNSANQSAIDTRRDDDELSSPQEEVVGTDLGVRVYNDSLPASLQPQTPRNLPEARHRSRLDGSHTAPAPRVASRTAQYSSWHYNRTRSPSGLAAPGFRGLFGGTENSGGSAQLIREALYYTQDEMDERNANSDD